MSNALSRSKIVQAMLLAMLLIASCSAPAQPMAQTPMATERATEQPTSLPTSVLATNSPQPSPTALPTNTPPGVGPDTYPENINPLTGKSVSDPELLERRPVMIKVSNYPASLRPHSGLSYADLVWEYFIGVGMTRFLALYYGENSPQVGPVRSGRLIDPQLALLYGGVLGIASADAYVFEQIREMLPQRYVSQTPATCPSFCRENLQSGVFVDTAGFTEYVRAKGFENSAPALQGMKFDSQPPAGGKPASYFWIYFSYYDQVAWDYDPVTGLYLRSQEVTQEDKTVQLQPITDRLTDEQLAFENVVILYAAHEILKPELIDTHLLNVEGMRAQIMRDGRLYEATYADVTGRTPLRFFDRLGNPFPFKPGSTWFTVVGLATELEMLEGGSWKMRFYP
ncbi:MAG: DUF3048 domain-containing protein [Chloroflexi bacterium]|nr:DUF3048 domain-containing protein [Chloroflexota bacterium]